MVDAVETKENPEASVWKELGDIRAVMIGAKGAGDHMQPMTPFVDAANKTVWFFTNIGTEMAQASKTGTSSKMCLMGTHKDFYACVNGRLSLRHNPEIIDRYWSSTVAAWFPEGRDDENLALLAFQPEDAAIWATTDSAIKYGWEILKSNLTSGTPDIGYQSRITIAGGEKH